MEISKNPNLRGGVIVTWQIEPSGSVSSASVVSSTLGNPRVEGCMLRQVKTWHFDPADSSTSVLSYPFRFGVGG
jgi:TonB family protein